MKHPFRILLLPAALTVGGRLGYRLLRNPSHIEILAFLAACSILGTVFYRIDRKFFAK